MRAILLCIACATFTFASHATAAWYEASSENFVVYSSQSKKAAQRFNERLEIYREAMRFFFGHKSSTPSKSNRLTVYVLPGNVIRQIYGEQGKRNITGVYLPRAGRATALVIPDRRANRGVNFSEVVLLHEYAHHYMYLHSSGNYPAWLKEGFAEFFGNASFEKNGSVSMGLPAYHRAGDITATPLPIRVLLDYEAYKASPERKIYAFYGQSWLLFHMLTFDPARKGQLQDYVIRWRSADNELTAAKAAFGDLDVLEQQMQDYAAQRNMPYLPIAAEKLEKPEVRTRKLAAEEISLVKLKAELARGFSQDRAQELIAKLQAHTQKYPKQSAGWAGLAEVLLTDSEHEQALEVAEKAIALDERNVDAHIHRANALAQQAESVGGRTAWSRARKAFVKANKIEKDHPLPLYGFYKTFRSEGRQPSKNGMAALLKAYRLAPYDIELRLSVVTELGAQQRYREALEALQPLRSSNHNRALSKAVEQLYNEIMDALKDSGA